MKTAPSEHELDLTRTHVLSHLAFVLARNSTQPLLALNRQQLHGHRTKVQTVIFSPKNLASWLQVAVVKLFKKKMLIMLGIEYKLNAPGLGKMVIGV